MTILEFPELKEVEGTLNERRKKLHDIFAEAGETFDMTKVKSLDGDSMAKVEAIRVMNEEIDELAKKAEGLRVVLRGAQNADEYSEDGTKESGDGGNGPREAKTLGDLIANDPRRLVKKVEFEVDIDLKATLLTSSGWAPQAVRTDRLIDFATRPPTILDFIPTVTTDQSAIVFMEETTFTNTAAETAEGAAKPQATLIYTERTSSVRKIPVFIPVSDEQLEDVPRMRALVNNRLAFMVRQRLAGQILVGDGIAPNLRGLLNVVGINTQAKGADPTPDAVYKAMVLCMTVGFVEPDLAVFNALDWQDVKLLRTADGIYIWGSPSDAGPNRIWGLPVVIEQGLTQNTAVVGAFGVFSELDIKKGLTVETGYNNDDFTKDLQTIRAEIRAAVVFYRPTAFATVTGV
jgi:HK97 family phage major capsid protein